MVAESPDRIAVSRGPGETRAALLAGDQPIEIVHLRDIDAQPGALYRGRIGKPGGDAHSVFIALGHGPDGLLQTKTQLPGEGRNVLVSIATTARGDKGPKLKLVDVDGGSGSPGIVKSAPDPVVLWARRYATALQEVVCDDTIDISRYTAIVGPRLTRHRSSHGSALFDELGIEDAIGSALEPRMVLAGGGSLIFEATAAAITIDVNAGGRPAKEVNRAAIELIASQLRLRNVCGHILVDVVPSKDRTVLLERLRSAVADDPAKPEIAGYTPLGMIELTRKRTLPSLAELLGSPDRPDPLGLAFRALRIAVQTARNSGKPHVKMILPAASAKYFNDLLSGAVEEARARIGGRLVVESFDSPVIPDFVIDAFA